MSDHEWEHNLTRITNSRAANIVGFLIGISIFEGALLGTILDYWTVLPALPFVFIGVMLLLVSRRILPEEGNARRGR